MRVLNEEEGGRQRGREEGKKKDGDDDDEGRKGRIGASGNHKLRDMAWTQRCYDII